MKRRKWQQFGKSLLAAAALLISGLGFPGETGAAAGYRPLSEIANGVQVTESDKIDGYYQFSPVITEETNIIFSDGWDNEFCTYGQKDAGVISYWWPQADVKGWSNTRSFIAEDSKKGAMYVDYTNVGIFQGDQVHMRITLLDWEKFYNLPDDSYTSIVISVDDNKPVIDIKGLLNVKVCFSYYNSKWEPITLSGHFSLSDLDFCQGFLLHDPVEHIYYNAAAEARMGYDSRNQIIWSDSSSTTPANPNGWVTYSYVGSSQTMTFYNEECNEKSELYSERDYNNWSADGYNSKWKGIYQTTEHDKKAWMTSEFGYTSEIMCRFSQKADVVLEKADEETGDLLSGAVFRLYEWNSGQWKDAGELEWEEPALRYVKYNIERTEENQGRFKIVEEKAPEGYEGQWESEFTVDKEGVTTVFYRVTNKSKYQRNQVTIHKLGICGKNQTEQIPLPRAVFQYWPDGARDQAITITTGEDGTAVFADLGPGRYCYRETKAPAGYVKDDEVKTFTIMDNGRCAESENGEFFVTNACIRLEILKTDYVTGDTVAGAKLRLLDEKENVIREWMSGESPEYFEGIAAGKYYLEETEVPEGYTLADTVEFAVEETGTVQTLVMKNLPYGQITIAKKIRQEEIIWAHGNPIFLFSVSGRDLQGNQHTYHTALEFEKEYVEDHADEHGYVVLEKVIGQIPVGESYEVKELQVNRYGLINVEATDGVTVEKLAEPDDGKRPEEIFHITANLKKNRTGTRIEFENRKYRFDDYSHNDLVINPIPIAHG